MFSIKLMGHRLPGRPDYDFILSDGVCYGPTMNAEPKPPRWFTPVDEPALAFAAGAVGWALNRLLNRQTAGTTIHLFVP